jgi:predicted metalloprotease with PDZ domain
MSTGLSGGASTDNEDASQRGPAGSSPGLVKEGMQASLRWLWAAEREASSQLSSPDKENPRYDSVSRESGIATRISVRRNLSFGRKALTTDGSGTKRIEGGMLVVRIARADGPVGLRCVGETGRVIHVEPGGAAETAGLRVFDRVTACNGVPLTKRPLNEATVAMQASSNLTSSRKRIAAQFPQSAA